MKAQIVETETITQPYKRIWIVKHPSGNKVFDKKSKAKKYKRKLDNE